MKQLLTTHPELLWAVTVIVSVWLLLTSPMLQAETPIRIVAINMGDHKFSPDEITVQAGDIVQLGLTNTDKLTPHNFTLQTQEVGLDVDVDVSAGHTQVVDLPPLTPGIYTYYCNKKLPLMKSHRAHGMEGKLIVEAASPD